MANKIPFTVYAKVTTTVFHTRSEHIYELNKIAGKIYDDLQANFAGNIATPGGSGDSSSLLTNGVAVKPAFGNIPSQVTIVGFTDGTADAPYGSVTLAHNNGYVTGPATGAPGWNAQSQPAVSSLAAVKALKDAIETAITSVDITITKIEINGVVYGHGGYTFPE